MLGLVMGMYWQHRRIWLRIDDRALLLGGHTNKNWLSIRRDVAAALAGMNVHVDQKALENKGGSPVES
jgi:cytochrome c biogenesis protein